MMTFARPIAITRNAKLSRVPLKLLAPLAALLLLLSACAPAAGEEAAGPVVALVNAPAEHRIAGVASGLQAAIGEREDCCPFSFTRTPSVRFQETHRDMFGSRAAPAAATIARNLGADLAVMAGAPVFERTVTEVEGGSELSGEVQLQAVVVDAQTESIITRVGSMTFSGNRFVPAGEPVPEPEDDPMMLRLRDQAVSDLAPYLATALGDLAGQYQ